MSTWVLGFFGIALGFTSGLAGQNKPTGYFFFSLNYTESVYPEPLKERKTAAEKLPDVNRIPLQADVIGYYRSRGDRVLLGGVLRFGMDRYSDYGNWLRIDSYQTAVSGVVFTDRQIGSGFFVRGDLGPALLRVSSRDAGTEYYRFGWGVLCATGFAFELYSHFFLPSFHYEHKRFRGKPHHSYGGGLGCLF